MTTNSPEDLRKMLQTLRDSGVCKCTFDTSYNLCSVEFFAKDDVEKMMTPDPKFGDMNIEEKACLCGHLEETEHSMAGCLKGCDLETCIGERKAIAS